MDEWLKSLGPGHFTYGARYICFLPAGKRADDAYIKFAEAPEGKFDDIEWMTFAERVTDYLNELIDMR